MLPKLAWNFWAQVILPLQPGTAGTCHHTKLIVHIFKKPKEPALVTHTCNHS
jgi:hypothetical protein